VIGKDEKIAIAWCDSGKVEGEFVVGINSSLMGTDIGHQFEGLIRSKGIKIATQRHEVLKTWMMPQFDRTDWLLWIDSDIEINYNLLKLLMDSADKEKFPVVSGLCFTFLNFDSEGLPIPRPCFVPHDEETKDKVLFNLKTNILDEKEMIRAESVGFGMLLMHKDVVRKLLKHFGNNKNLFLEIEGEDPSDYIGEDFSFCLNLKEINVPIYVNTRVIPAHWKTIPLDYSYYKFYNQNKINK
jgi:hypothetical protein